METKQTASSIRRWRMARRLTLSAIVMAGVMATAATATYRLAAVHCPGHQQAREYTYPGIGVEIEHRGDDFVVRRVFPNTPADGKVLPGAVLISADGERPETVQGWTTVIRGEPGSDVEIEVAYPCSGHETVTIERDVIHIEY